MRVFVTVYDHRHGSDIRVFATEAGADAYREKIARQYWTSEMNDKKPETGAADLYFARMADRDEFFNLHVIDVEA